MAKSQLYEEPKNFTTLNFQSYFSSLATNVTKIVGVKGNGVRLEATRGILDTTVTPAFITNGDISNIPYGGVPINRMPDSLTGFIRTNFASGDTGVLAIFFKRVGIPISINIFLSHKTLQHLLDFRFHLAQVLLHQILCSSYYLRVV